MNPSRQQQALARFTASVATAFLVAVCCAFPLYIDRFSNLGLVKFSGVFVLLLGFSLMLGACAAIGARPAPGRLSSRSGGLLSLAAFVVASTVSTCVSLQPLASVWGLGSYYGGWMLVLLTAVGYVGARAFTALKDLDFVFFGIGVTSSAAVVLYVLNIFNIDLIGAYAKTAVVERAQFFSTLGQKDFCGGFFALALPIVFYAYLHAEGPRRTALYAVPMVFGALAMAVVDAEALTLGIVAAAMILVCHRDFTTRTVRRGAWIGISFFLCAGWMHLMRASVYTQGGRSLLSRFGDWDLAVPGTLFCLAVWAGLRWRAWRGRPEVSLCRLGRVLTAVTLAAVTVLFLAATFVPGFPSLGALDNFFKFNDDWGTYRGVAWKAAFAAWWDAPLWRKLLGYGPGTFHEVIAAWAGDAMTARLNTFYAAHSEYIEQLLSTGLLGLAAWGAFLFFHLRRGFAGWYRPYAAPVLLALCSYLVQAAVSIRVSMLFPLVMLLFGVLAAATAPQPPARPEPSAAPPRKTTAPRPGLRYAQITLAAVVAMALCAPLSRALLWFLF